MASKPVCKYGASCYRKNPDHFKQYSHPGQSEGVEGGVGLQAGGGEGEKRRGRERPTIGTKATEASRHFAVSAWL